MTPAAPETLAVDDVTFAVRRSRRRRTIGITIPHEGPPVVAVPARCSRRLLEAAVRAKLGWVRRKLGERDALPQLPPHRYEPGERFPYLGGDYELLLVDERPADGAGAGDDGRRGRRQGGRRPMDQLSFDDLAVPTVDELAGEVGETGGSGSDGSLGGLRLREGRFELARSEQAAACELFRVWYRRRAADVLNERVAHFASRVGVAPPPVAVKDMRSRWGSCSAKGRISLHWGLVLLPIELVDYVVVHELAHLRELNHAAAFWGLVGQVLPDYQERRRRLKARDGRVLL